MFSQKQTEILHEFFADIDDCLPLNLVEKIHDATGIPTRLIHICALERGLIPLRYRRNIGTIGVEGQLQLLKSTALVIGLGGLGGNVIEQLARIGVGTLLAADYDNFDETNLNRQLLSSHGSLGRSKAETAVRRIAQINTDTEVTVYSKKLDALDDEVFEKCDIVFDCLDNIPDRLVLADRCARANVTLIHAAIASWYGQIAVIKPSSGFMQRVYKDFDKTEIQNKQLEKKLGTPPFTAAAAASIMTAQGIKVLTGQKINENELITFDLLTNELQSVRV